MTTVTDARGERPQKCDLVKSVAVARALYNQDPQRHVLTLAHALYNAQYLKRYVRELTALRKELMDDLALLVSPDFNHYYRSDHYDRIDMVTTYFAFIVGRKHMSQAEQDNFRRTASMLCLNALHDAGSPLNMKHPHSYYLIATTYVSMNTGTDEAWDLLQIVADNAARHITDPNFTSRVYRRLGLLFPREEARLGGEAIFESWYWGLMACRVRGISWKTQLKNIYALITGRGF